MFKRIIICLLALCFCAALTGCTNEDDSSESYAGEGSSSGGGMNIHEMWTDEP